MPKEHSFISSLRPLALACHSIRHSVATPPPDVNFALQWYRASVGVFWQGLCLSPNVRRLPSDTAHQSCRVRQPACRFPIGSAPTVHGGQVCTVAHNIVLGAARYSTGARPLRECGGGYRALLDRFGHDIGHENSNRLWRLIKRAFPPVGGTIILPKRDTTCLVCEMSR